MSSIYILDKHAASQTRLTHTQPHFQSSQPEWARANFAPLQSKIQPRIASSAVQCASRLVEKSLANLLPHPSFVALHRKGHKDQILIIAKSHFQLRTESQVNAFNSLVMLANSHMSVQLAGVLSERPSEQHLTVLEQQNQVSKSFAAYIVHQCIKLESLLQSQGPNFLIRYGNEKYLSLGELFEGAGVLELKGSFIHFSVLKEMVLDLMLRDCFKCFDYTSKNLQLVDPTDSGLDPAAKTVSTLMASLAITSVASPLKPLLVGVGILQCIKEMYAVHCMSMLRERGNEPEVMDTYLSGISRRCVPFSKEHILDATRQISINAEQATSTVTYASAISSISNCLVGLLVNKFGWKLVKT